MANDEKKLQVTLQFKTDRQSAQQVAKAAERVGDQVERAGAEAAKELARQAQEIADRYEKTAQQVSQRMQLIRDAADIGGEIAEGFVAAGAAITGPLLLSINSYVQSAGRAEALSRRWMVATEEISDAQQRVGRVAAQAVLPLLEQAADVAERAAQFAEDNPDVIRAALKVGTIVAGLGAVGVAVSRGIRLVADTKQLIAEAAAAKLQRDAANKQLAAAALQAKAAGGGIAGGAASAAGGGLSLAGLAAPAAILGVGAAAAYGIDKAGQAATGRSLGQNWTEFSSIVSYGLGSLIGKGEEFFKFTSGLGDRLTKTADEAERAANELESFEDAIGPATWRNAVQAYQDFQDNQLEIFRRYQQQRETVIEQFGEQRADAEARYAAQRADIIADYAEQSARALRDFERDAQRTADRHNASLLDQQVDFARQQAQADADYYAQRALQARDYGIEVQRAEEDHQRAMARMREDYEMRVEDAAISRDAIALRNAQREYARDRSRSEEDYSVQAARRNEDYGRQIADQEAAYAQQRAQREAEFERRLQEQQAQYEQERAEREAEFAERQAREAEQHQEKIVELDTQHQDEMVQLDAAQQETLAELADQYGEEQQLLKDSFQAQLNAMDSALLGMTAIAQNRYAQMEADFTAWLNQMRSATSNLAVRPPGRAAGGYADYGMYTLGEAGREYVLNAQTTSALESVVGGPLTQQSVLQSGGGPSIAITSAPQFNNVTQADRGWIESALAQNNQAILRQVAEALNG